MKRGVQTVLLILFAVLVVAAQDKPAPEAAQPKPNQPLSFYKVEYVLRELQDDKVANSRTYSMTVENEKSGEAKVGTRIPVNTGHDIHYWDVGINVRCRITGKEDYASLFTMVDISTFALPEQASGDSNPIVRQMHTEMMAAVPLGKRTVIGVIDDANSTKRYEIAVTATKLH